MSFAGCERLLLFWNEIKERKGEREPPSPASRLTFCAPPCNLSCQLSLTEETHPPYCSPRPKNSTISFSEFNGAHGIIAGCLVALTQVMPDQDVSWGGNGGGGIRVKHLLAGYVAAATVVSVFTKSLLSTLPVVLMGAYSSWLYLRFVQVKEGLGLR